MTDARSASISLPTPDRRSLRAARQASNRRANRSLRVGHALQRDAVEQSSVEREQYGDLVRNCQGSELSLFQRRANPPAVFDCLAGGLIEPSTEAGKGLQLLKLRISELDVAGDRPESRMLRLAAHPRN